MELLCKFFNRNFVKIKMTAFLVVFVSFYTSFCCLPVQAEMKMSHDASIDEMSGMGDMGEMDCETEDSFQGGEHSLVWNSLFEYQYLEVYRYEDNWFKDFLKVGFLKTDLNCGLITLKQNQDNYVRKLWGNRSVFGNSVYRL